MQCPAKNEMMIEMFAIITYYLHEAQYSCKVKFSNVWKNVESVKEEIIVNFALFCVSGWELHIKTSFVCSVSS